MEGSPQFIETDEYLQFLPSELLCQVLSYFPILQIYPILSRVSTLLRKRLLQGCLWTNIEGISKSIGGDGRVVCTPTRVVSMIQFLKKNGLMDEVKTFDLPRCKLSLPCPTTNQLSGFFSSLRCLSIRNSTLGFGSPLLFSDECQFPINSESFVWRQLKCLNLTNSNLTNSLFFQRVTLPNVETLILSGVVSNSTEDVMNFILRSNSMLKNLDISRTRLDDAQVTHIMRSSLKLEKLIATELKWKPTEESLLASHGHIRVRTQLLPHRRDILIRRIPDVACLYDVDGRGCSLLADAIYVGIKCDVVQYLIECLNIDVNRCDVMPSPWVLPYPTKYIESFELLRSPLGFHQCILLNKFDIADMLLRYNANLYGKTPAGLTPLMTVVHSTIIDANARDSGIQYLLEKGVMVDYASLLNSIEKAHSEELILKMLDKREGPCNINRMLHEAIMRCQPKVAARLVEIGGDIASNVADGRDNCLVSAIKRRNCKLVEALLDTLSPTLSPALQAKDNFGWTALRFAISILPNTDLERLVNKMVAAGACVDDLVNSKPELLIFNVAEASIRNIARFNPDQFKKEEEQEDEALTSAGGEVIEVCTPSMESELRQVLTPEEVIRCDIIKRLLLSSATSKSIPGVKNNLTRIAEEEDEEEENFKEDIELRECA